MWALRYQQPISIALRSVLWASSARLLSILLHGRCFWTQWLRPMAARPSNITSFRLTWTRAPSTPAGQWTWRRQLHTTARPSLHRSNSNDLHSALWATFFMLDMGAWGLHHLSWLGGGGADK